MTGFRWIAKILIFNLALASVSVVFAAETARNDHKLIRRLVVFPMRAEKGFESIADEAWWQGREELTKSRRFLVASKQFLIKSDAWQSRGALEPADAIILGRILDAHALLTLELAGRKLNLWAYDGTSGLTLYQKQVNLHPSKTIADQLPQLTRRLIADFVATMPYQGYTTLDSLVGSTVFQEGDARFADVDLGFGSQAKVGDQVQWIKMTLNSLAPVFQGGAQMKVFADGKIVRINDGLAVAEILRVTSVKDITEYSLVRVPREAARLAAEETLTDQPRTTLTVELVSPEANPVQRVAEERRPLLTTFSFIGSIVGFLLLAF